MRPHPACGVLAVAGTLILAACTPPPPAAPPVAAAPAAPAGADPANPDGVYDGTSTRYQADRRDCPHPGLVEIYVQNRAFTYRWAWGMDVPAVIQPDGSVSGQDGAVQLTGQLDGAKMSGDLTNGACSLHFTVTRRFRGA